MDYTIEHDVPLPATGHAGMYPWTEMKEGDSFLIPLTDKDLEPEAPGKRSLCTRTHAKVKRYADEYKRNVDPGLVVAIRKRTAQVHQECGLRVWRIKPKTTKI